jgi:hypothetical protein
MLQTAWRGKCVRAEKQKQTEAATKIQSVFRGHKARANPPVPSDGSDEDDPTSAVPVAPLPPVLRGRQGSQSVPAVSVEEQNVRELLLQVCLQTKPHTGSLFRSFVGVWCLAAVVGVASQFVVAAFRVFGRQSRHRGGACASRRTRLKPRFP